MKPGDLVFVKTTGEEVAVLGLDGNRAIPDEVGPVSGTTVIVRRALNTRDGVKHVLDYFLIEELETLEERVRRDHNNQDVVKKTIEAVHGKEEKQPPGELLN